MNLSTNENNIVHKTLTFQFSNLPVCTLLGGRYGESVELYRAISMIPPKEMAENVAKYRK